MKLTAQILLFAFITFLVTPTIVSVIKKSADVSVFYSFSEEEKAQKEIKGLFSTDVAIAPVNLSRMDSGMIHYENLSKHDKISSKIFIPPPEQV
jgi:hypothetical protein